MARWRRRLLGRRVHRSTYRVGPTTSTVPVPLWALQFRAVHVLDRRRRLGEVARRDRAHRVGDAELERVARRCGRAPRRSGRCAPRCASASRSTSSQPIVARVAARRDVRVLDLEAGRDRVDDEQLPLAALRSAVTVSDDDDAVVLARSSRCRVGSPSAV